MQTSSHCTWDIWGHHRTMGMQPVLNYAPTSASAYGQPLPMAYTPAPAMSQYGIGMTQLPSVPRPPYLQAPAASPLAMPNELPTPDQLLRATPPMQTTTYVIPGVFGNGGLAPIGPIPAPCQAAPAVCAPPRPAYQTAASFPLNTLDTPAEVPPPYLLAPWLYGLRPTGYQQTIPTVASANQGPIQGMQSMSQQQRPMPPAQPPVPQPMQQPMQPPQAPQTPPAPTENKGPTTPLDDGGLNDQQIRSLNERLNSETEDTRADAAMELFKILDQDPTLSTREPYSRYVNAFMEKILKDPSGVVRSAGELALQTGRVKQPSEGVMGLLSELSKRPSGLSGESGIISSLLGSIRNQTLGQGFDSTPGAMTIDPYTRSRTGQASPPNANIQPTGAEATKAPEGMNQPGMPSAFPPQGGGFDAATASQAYGPNAAAYGQMPAASGMAPAPNQLNYLSPSQLPSAQMAPNPTLGQRLNLQEGYR